VLIGHLPFGPRARDGWAGSSTSTCARARRLPTPRCKRLQLRERRNSFRPRRRQCALVRLVRVFLERRCLQGGLNRADPAIRVDPCATVCAQVLDPVR